MFFSKKFFVLFSIMVGFQAVSVLPVLAGTDDHEDIVPVIDIGIMIRQGNPHRAGIGRDTPLTIKGTYNGTPR